MLEKSNDRNHNNLNIGDRILEIDEEEIESSQQAYMLLRHAKNNCCRLTILRPDKIVKTSSMTVESEIEDGMLVIRPTNSLKNQNSQKSKISKFSRGSNSTDSDPSQVQEILKKLNINPNVFQTDQLKMISFNNKECNGDFGFKIGEKPSGTGAIDRIYVKNISPNSAAADSNGIIEVNDLILTVNNYTLRNRNYYEAMEILSVESRKENGATRLILIPDGAFKNTPKSTPSFNQIRENYKNTNKSTTSSNEPIEVILRRPATNQPWGISLLGGADTKRPISIYSISKNGAAEKDNRLSAGDKILAINDNAMKTATHNEAIMMLKNAQLEVKFLVLKHGSSSSHMSHDSYSSPDQNKKIQTMTRILNRPLGISIKSDSKVPFCYIDRIHVGGEAAIDGQLRENDRILSIDGKDCSHSDEFHIAQLLKAGGSTTEIRIERGRYFGRHKSPSMLPTESTISNSTHHTQNNTNYSPAIYNVDNTRQVNIYRSSKAQPLGLSVAGGVGSPLGNNIEPFIALVNSKGAAYEKVYKGEMLIAIDGTNCRGLTHDQVINLLKQCGTQIKLELGKPSDRTDHLSSYLENQKKQRSENLSTASGVTSVTWVGCEK